MDNTGKIIEIKTRDLEERHREIAEAIGLDNFLKLCETCGGNQYPLPGVQWFLLRIAKRKILERYSQDKTLTAKQLAEMYGVSVSAAYNYMKEVGK